MAAALALCLQPEPVAAQNVELPKPPIAAGISIQAAAANTWREPAHDVWILHGRCVLRQGPMTLEGQAAVVWAHRGRYGELTNRLTVFLEADKGEVELRFEENGKLVRMTDASWYGELESTSAPQFSTPPPGPEPEVKPPVYLHALARRNAYRDGVIRRTQFVQPAPSVLGQPPGQPLANPPPPESRRVQVFPRSSAGIQADVRLDQARNEWVAVISSGINVIVDGLGELGSFDVSTDRMVIWTGGGQTPNVPGQTLQARDTPLEFYMEGNIVFRQGERVIYADRMYYDVRNEVGVVYKVELLTPVENYQGTLRMRADVVQQIARGQFRATNAYITSSRLGVPGYRLAADDIFVEDQQQPRIDPLTGEVMTDPLTGEAIIDHQRRATSENNLFLIEEIPIFYWPVFTADLERSSFFIRNVKLKNDNVFGTQIYTTWDPYQLLSIDPIEGTDWDLSLDYLSERGFGHGSKFAWNRPSLFGLGGPAAGFIDYWGIQEQDLDNLGADRRSLLPEKDYRFRLLGRNRWLIADDWRLTSEVGWISDRNFLEQYFESEWDRFKDATTGVELKRYLENGSLALSADVRLNSFFNEVEQLPRFDFFTIGQPLLGDWLTWHQHTHAGLYRMLVPSTGENAADRPPFSNPLLWEPSDFEGGRYATRHEIDLPLQLGPVKVVPRALGELAHWDEVLSGDDADRAYGQLGVKFSLPIWGADPTVESDILNVHGLAHKVNLWIDASISAADRGILEFPLYDPLDDNSIEHFRRRFPYNTFGTPLRPQFDERLYALRSGLGDWVTSPSTEIADDLEAVRLGIDQRWQTKRGLPGTRQLQDFIVLNAGVTWFPDEDRDNFGEAFGLWNYDFRWHLGERTTLLSRGIYDFFDQGQQLTSVGIYLKRPPIGDVYIGLRSLEGPIDSEVLQFSHTYRMSPKWISEFSTGYDFAAGQNIGQRLSLLRIGESFLVAVGFHVDASKNAFGVNFNLEPRFLPRTRLGRVSGAQIPPAGAFGLE
jgi:hypothetical protein